MRVLKMLGGLLVAVLVVVVGGGLLLPDQVRVERSIVIERPPAVVFAALNGFGRFNDWSPWRDFDPSARYRFEGPASGVGARMEWHGDKGGGSQQIVDSIAEREIVNALQFDDSRGTARFQLVPDGDGTRLTWVFETGFDGNLIGRWLGLMFDRWIGQDYERGLQSLKQLLESEPVPAAPTAVPTADHTQDPPTAG